MACKMCLKTLDEILGPVKDELFPAFGAIIEGVQGMITGENSTKTHYQFFDGAQYKWILQKAVR
jgi:hypothetical protein